MSEDRKPNEHDGVADAAAEAAEDVADEFLGLKPRRDPTPGPPATTRG